MGAGGEVEEGGFSRPVAADDGDKIPLIHLQIQVLNHLFFVHRAGVKDHPRFFQTKHPSSSVPESSFSY